jgi:hypothetical protein
MFMMEILINENEWKSADKTRRLTQIIDSLRNSGWERFGHCGTIVLFKDVPEQKAKAELQDLNISEVLPESWEEDMYAYNVF